MTTLADVLAAHRTYYEYVPLNRNAWWCYGCDWGGETQSAATGHAVEAVAAAGLAVIQLPEPVDGVNNRDWDGAYLLLRPTEIDDRITESGLLTPVEAREKAAALLAAAAAAEAAQL